MKKVDKLGADTNSWGAPQIGISKRFKYEKELEQIKAMGYDDEEAIKSALNITSGQVKQSLSRIQMNRNINTEMTALTKYSEQIKIIKKMGIEDEVLMIEFLQETNGDINATTVKLLATLNNP